MGKVIFDISMSLDGFITAANARPEAGLGDGGERLHEWGFDNPSPLSQKFMDWYGQTGAIIFGRNTYDNSIIHWGKNGPSGAHRIPTFIVAHARPSDVPEDGVYTFVDSVEAALENARALAGDKDIYIGGANVASQLMKLGKIDEIVIHVVPVLFGSGTRLHEDLSGKHTALELVESVETKEAIHLRYRIL
jgi:dihydrofolate reductase